MTGEVKVDGQSSRTREIAVSAAGQEGFTKEQWAALQASARDEITKDALKFMALAPIQRLTDIGAVARENGWSPVLSKGNQAAAGKPGISDRSGK
ncbi:hypothetical protein H257_16434 [Aphanomyces astaci]|uniref:Uncharacterized protein n=1 Tax=Aphanomyces astaci TaxID=112090 RepID=W4FIN2_APHAT|nr:hypothetical protein H257_16434 [Aphanomyces astaci]ETV67350.1 hypothetical protein H257_16434 [Aphanomyces astaci]|eukprot:XP_009843165.1 hypothetical protein H257_16434 [Aphanomyces astaci]